MQPTLRSFDLAHLAHVELLTPKPEQSLDFFVNVLGLTESGRRGDSVYLRGWDDYEHHTLKLTAAKAAGMGHFAFRTTSPEALERRAGILEKAGFGAKGTAEADAGKDDVFDGVALLGGSGLMVVEVLIEACLEADFCFEVADEGEVGDADAVGHRVSG